MDLISRLAAIDICNNAIDLWNGQIGCGALVAVKDRISGLPSAEPEIIRCKDCKWYDTTEEMKCGYCEAIKHSYYSRNWEINIHRKYPPDFYCADAEPKDEEEEDE